MFDSDSIYTGDIDHDILDWTVTDEGVIHSSLRPDRGVYDDCGSAKRVCLVCYEETCSDHCNDCDEPTVLLGVDGCKKPWEVFWLPAHPHDILL